MTIKLEQYKIFNEAASTQSFSLAARNLFISQSAVSQAIHLLERTPNPALYSSVQRRCFNQRRTNAPSKNCSSLIINYEC